MTLGEYLNRISLDHLVIVFTKTSQGHSFMTRISNGFPNDPSHTPYLDRTVLNIKQRTNSAFKEIEVG